MLSTRKNHARLSSALYFYLIITGFRSRKYTYCRNGFSRVLYILQANTIMYTNLHHKRLFPDISLLFIHLQSHHSTISNSS